MFASSLAISISTQNTKIVRNWQQLAEESTALRTEAKAKNLNGYVVAGIFRDPQCMTQESSFVFPLNKCIPDVAGFTDNAFFVGTLDSAGKSRLQGYTDSACKRKGPAAPLERFPPPSCMANQDRTSNRFVHAEKAPYHPLGWTVNIYPNSQCAGPYVQEQFNTNCITTGNYSSQHLFCGVLGDGNGHAYMNAQCSGTDMNLGQLPPIAGQSCVSYNDNGNGNAGGPPFFKKQGCDGRAPMFN